MVRVKTLKIGRKFSFAWVDGWLQKDPLTLWVDIFALQILYSMKTGVQVMFQPCYA